MRDRSKWVLWPLYFDADASRLEGRRVSKEMAVKNPTAEDILRAAGKMGLKAVKEEKAHPSRWWRKEGRVLVEKKFRKMETIRRVAEIIKQSKNNK